MKGRNTIVEEAELAAYHAGLLKEAARRALEARLAGDPVAQSMLADWRAQDDGIAALYAAPSDIPVPDRLLAVLRSADAAAPPRQMPVPRHRIAVVAAVCLVVGGLGGWGLSQTFAPVTRLDDFLAIALRAHATYVVEVVHPVEVGADNPEHLTTWLSKRVGVRLELPDLSAEGFRLLGGRVVPAEPGAAALLMYEDAAGRRVTLFVTRHPPERETAFRFASDVQAQSLSWVDGTLSCAVTGDLPRAELERLAGAAYEQLL